MKAYINLLNNRKLLWSVGFLILSIYFLPYFTQGQNVHLITFDNLDSVVPQFKILAESGKIFSDSMDIIPNMMNGLPRLSYGSEFNVILWLYYFFNDFTAYVINDIVVHIVAFVAMIILLSRYIIVQELKYRNLLIFSIALMFALVPFWSNGGLSVSGQPLVLYAFLNIRGDRDNKWDWLILILMPFYSSFIVVFFFFLFAAGLVFLYDIYKTKQINYKFILAIILMTSIYLLVEYRVVYSMFTDTGFISHRIEFNLAHQNFDTCYKMSHVLFLNGQEHNINLHYRFILPVILLAMFIALKKEKFNLFFSSLILSIFLGMFLLNLWGPLLTNEPSLPSLLIITLFIWLLVEENKLLPFLMMIQILIAYLTVFINSESAGEMFPFLNTINIRFIMLQTLIWYILIAMSLQVLFQKLQFSILILLNLMIFQTLLSFGYRNFTKEHVEQASYKTYYASELYSQIESFIGEEKESYRIANIGIQPAISLYNGFYTIDGYSPNYPLSYKHEFRKIIKKYLDSFKKHQGDSFIFDDWGSKAYILNSQYMCSVYRETTLKDLGIDVKQLSHLGVKYIFSAYEIEDYKKMDLTFLKKFDSPDTNWPVYLYKLN